jgi:hypothetical protein
LPNLLVYNLPVDPLLGMPFALFFTIPFIYGAVQYELLNVKVIAKQAFWYSLAVFSVGGGFHCVTMDTVREGRIDSYFE